MKKINEYLDKNIENILVIFVILQPIIDLITSLTIRITSLEITLGILIRGFMLVLLFYYYVFIVKSKTKKKELIYIGICFLYFILYLLNILIYKDLSLLFIELKYLVKVFYFPLSLLFIYNIIKYKNIEMKKIKILLPIILYISTILISIITNTGFSSYGGYKIGTSGWYYAANEIGTIIAILSPIVIIKCINIKSEVLKYLLLFIYIIVSLLIGTKVPFLGVIISLFIFVFYYFVRYVILKNKENIKKIFFPIIICIMFFFLIFSYLPGGKNLGYHLKLVNLNGLSDIFENKIIDEEPNPKPVEEPNPKPVEEHNPKPVEEHNGEVKKEPDPMNVIYSSRDVYLKKTKSLYKDSDFWQKLMGIGFVENYGTSEQSVRSIEMDFHDLFYRFGVIGFILYLIIPFMFIFNIIIKYFKKFKENFLNENITSLIIALFLSLGIATIAGHNLNAPAVSIYTVLILIFLNELVNKKELKSKNLWIDITNSPHAILFNPIINKLKDKGYNIRVTARDYAQTIGLLDEFKIDYLLIGDHKGKSKIKKIWGLFQRSIQLYWYAKDKDFVASLSMSSQTCMVASKMLGIPHMTLYDYEYTSGHHIDFRLSKQILTPKGVEEKTLKHYGAKMKNVIFYPGLKEQFYIYYYMNEFNKKYNGINPIKSKYEIDKDRILIVIRPEATVAHYQSNENSLCFDLVEYLSNHESKPAIIVLPRISSQKQEYKDKKYKNVIIPDEILNGIDLVASADLVIGAGGTVNREAASIGVPAYTIYQGGLLGAVDRMLIETKRMIKIENVDDFKKIKIKKNIKKPKPIGDDFSDLYVKLVDKLAGKK